MNIDRFLKKIKELEKEMKTRGGNGVKNRKKYTIYKFLKESGDLGKEVRGKVSLFSVAEKGEVALDRKYKYKVNEGVGYKLFIVGIDNQSARIVNKKVILQGNNTVFDFLEKVGELLVDEWGLIRDDSGEVKTIGKGNKKQKSFNIYVSVKVLSKNHLPVYFIKYNSEDNKYYEELKDWSRYLKEGELEERVMELDLKISKDLKKYNISKLYLFNTLMG